MQSKIRMAKDRDWLAVLALLDQVQPDTINPNRVWLAERKRFNPLTARRRHYVAEADGPEGAPILTAYAGIEEGPEPEEFRMFLLMEPDQLAGLGETLLAGLMRDLAGLDARLVTSRAEISSPVHIFLRRNGFREELRIPGSSDNETAIMVKRLKQAGSG